MAGPTSLPLVGKLLLASALGCGASGVLLLQDYALLGLVLCVLALADLCLVWLLWRWSLAGPATPFEPVATLSVRRLARRGGLLLCQRRRTDQAGPLLMTKS